MNNKEENDRLREKSGTIKSNSKLVGFLYELMRDHLPTATVEMLVRYQMNDDDDTVVFTNGWLAKYAEDLANRLSDK